MQQQRTARQGKLGFVLVCVVALGLVAFAADLTTIRIVPDVSVVHSYTAFPGERIRVELDGGWTAVRSTNPAVVAPLGGNWFVAWAPGSANLTAVSIRCPRCAVVTFLWRAAVEVRIPGT